MSDTTARPDMDQRLREALDWAIFGLGVVSLTTALTATVVSHTDLFSADTPQSASQTTNV